MPAPSETVSCSSCGQLFAAGALFCPACGTAKARNFEGDPLLGTRVGERFLIVERIGHGASGTIYLGEHVTLRRKVAVKVLHHELSRDDLAVERFRREATTVSEIENEHIVQIHDFGRTDDGRLYLAMEYLEGETLDEVLRREKRLPVEQAVDILIQLGEALMEAHALGYIHRDLRPRNIYLAVRRGRANFVKLLDFGLAKLVEKEGEAASTSLGMTFGEPKYMSPEQARGEPVDRRADIYSLGCIAYEMLVGEPPFSSGKVFDILSRHVDTVPPPPTQRRPELPPWIDVAIMRMLAKRADERFITVYRMVEALRQGLETGSIMSEEVARRRESVPPPSVSQAIEKLGRTALGTPPGPKESDRETAQTRAARAAEAANDKKKAKKKKAGAQTVLGRETRPERPLDPTPVPRPIPGLMDDRDTERNSERIERELSRAEHKAEPTPRVAPVPPPEVVARADDDEDLRRTIKREPRRRKRPSTAQGKSGGGLAVGDASTSSTGLSGAWYADGENLDGDDELDASQQRKLARARAAISPSVDEDDDYFPPPRNRAVWVAGGLGGLVLLIALIAYFWPSGGSGKTTAKAALSDGAGSAEPTPSEAIAPAEPAEPVAPTPPAATGDPELSPTPEPATPKPVDRAPKPKPVDRAPKPKPVDRAPKPKPDPVVVPKPDPVPDPPPPDNTAADKQQADFFAKMGQTSLKSGDILGAATNFNKALKLDSGNGTAITGLGEIALSQGSYGAAVTHLKKASKLRSRSARVWTLLGDAYLGAGDNDQAVKAFKKALAIDPDNDRAKDGLASAGG